MRLAHPSCSKSRFITYYLFKAMFTVTQSHNLEAPRLITSLPGPKAKAIIARDQAVTSPSYTREYPLVVKRGEGCLIEDVDGNIFLDQTAGIAVAATGHAHPQVVQAIQEQSAKLLHMCGADFYYEPLAQLAETLAAKAPFPQTAQHSRWLRPFRDRHPDGTADTSCESG